MDLAGFIAALEKFFNDILGSVIPGLFLIYGLKFVLFFDTNAVDLASLAFDDHPVAFTIVGFLLGHLLDQFYRVTLRNIAEFKYLLATIFIFFCALITTLGFLPLQPLLIMTLVLISLNTIVNPKSTPRLITKLSKQIKKSTPNQDGKANKRDNGVPKPEGVRTSGVIDCSASPDDIIDRWFCIQAQDKLKGENVDKPCRKLECIEQLDRSTRRSIAMSISEDAQNLGRRFRFISLLCSSTATAFLIVTVAGMATAMQRMALDLPVSANFDQDVAVSLIILSWFLIGRAVAFSNRADRAASAAASVEILKTKNS